MIATTLTIYACPVSDCTRWIGTDADTDGSGDLGWNPDGWPFCGVHKRPMKPVKVEPVRESPDTHPAGCFYGSFAEAYDDAWHVPHGVDCRLDHGEHPVQLGAPAAAVPETEEGRRDA